MNELKIESIETIDEITEGKYWEAAKAHGKIKEGSMIPGEQGSYLAKEINDNAFTGAIVYSLQRKGKSSYAMQVMYELYGNWEDVFKNMFYRLDHITAYLTARLENDTPLPCVLWDDAGVHASKLLYFKDKDQADMIKRLFDVIGIATRGIILTTPVPDELLKSLRSYEFLKIKIMDGRNRNDRLARCYKNILWPSGARRNPKYFEDEFDVRLPDDIFQRYNPIRKGYYIQSLRDLRDCIETKKLEACVKQELLKRQAEELNVICAEDCDLTELDRAARQHETKLSELNESSVLPAGLPGDQPVDRNNISSVLTAPEISHGSSGTSGQKKEYPVSVLPGKISGAQDPDRMKQGGKTNVQA